jgi:drug/metabolite transporter (DMT)-like permease
MSDAQTFVERLRARMSNALMIAGLICTVLCLGLILVIWLGAWSPETQQQRLDYLGNALFGTIAGMGLVIVSLAIGGPVGRLSGKIGPAEFNAEDDNK